MTLARAAPISVPATPKNEATTAEETAASALAAIWTGLSWVRGAPVEGPSGRSTDSVRGEFMSSEGSASGGRAAGKKEVPSDRVTPLPRLRRTGRCGLAPRAPHGSDRRKHRTVIRATPVGDVPCRHDGRR